MKGGELAQLSAGPRLVFEVMIAVDIVVPESGAVGGVDGVASGAKGVRCRAIQAGLRVGASGVTDAPHGLEPAQELGRPSGRAGLASGSDLGQSDHTAAASPGH